MPHDVDQQSLAARQPTSIESAGEPFIHADSQPWRRVKGGNSDVFWNMHLVECSAKEPAGKRWLTAMGE
jgi:hypothetical protein